MRGTQLLLIVSFAWTTLPVVAADIPENAHTNILGTGWECDKGYRRSGSRCVGVQVPDHAHLDFLGHGWECDKGFKRVANQCQAMTPAEIEQQRELEKALLNKMLKRRAGVTGDDCEWEYEAEAEVCVTTTDASLDCNKSYAGNYYRGCEVEIDYELVTSYEGDGYLDVEVECSAEIEYKGRDFAFWRSDSADDDESHNLYALGSDSGDVTLDFSFSSYKEVIRVKLDSAECEIESVNHY